MSGARGSGFTIIEVMLFLAISGFLVVGMMSGAGVAINVQRYKDATNSFLSYIQGQYDRAANVQSDHLENLHCDAAGTITTSSVTVTRGASEDCYIVGRLLTVSDGGKKITAQSVYASGVLQTSGADVTALSSINLFTDATVEVAETYTPEWSTHLVLPKPNNTTTMDDWRLLIVRSPSTGTIRTFTTMDNSLTTLQSIIASPATRADVTACVSPDGLTITAPRGAKIIKDASGMSAVKMTNEGEC